MSVDLALAADAAKFYSDPYGFVMWAFPWQEEGTLADWDGPLDWQKEVLESVGRQVKERGFDGKTPVDPIQEATASGHGIGKAHRPWDWLPTLGGQVQVDQIRAGDFLIAPNGHPVRVNAVKEWKDVPFYRVTFDDGSSVEVSSGHLWKVKGRNERRANRDWQVLSTEDIVQRGVKRPNGKAMARQWEIPIQAPARYPDHNLPVDPYTYGVWLGDGNKRSGRITNIDDEVWDNIAYPRAHFGTTRTAYGLKVDLKNAGLFGCSTYTASVDRRYIESLHRLDVLQGLLDTDGWVEQCGAAAFESASRQLTRDVIEIARSLGLKARQEKFKPNDHAGSWATHITWNGEIPLFRIRRKQESLVAAENRYQKRWIDKIEAVDPSDGICVEVDGGMYLCKDFIATHNSALTSWIILWLMSTRPRCRGTVTANTADQLKTKTWGELAKWHRMCITGHWFEYANSKGNMNLKFKDNPDNWRVDAQTCKEENSEAFAGQHAADSTSFYLFDEASNVPNKIWEVAEGGLTDGEPLFLCFGNPTRNHGRFFDCFHRFRHRWVCRQIDSRTVPITNKDKIKQWVQDWGEDSDFVRVRVAGRFPRAGANQLIPSDVVYEATRREARFIADDPTIVGIDVARGGEDRNVIVFRKGFDAQSFPTYVIPGEKSRDSMALVSFIVDRLTPKEGMDPNLVPDRIFVDETGLGGPIVDRLLQLGLPVVGINFGSSAMDNQHYRNRVAEMWFNMRAWLMKGGAIKSHPDLEMELTARQFKHDSLDRLQLESKDDMKKRDLPSPDWADALALTFALPVAPIERDRWGNTITHDTGHAVTDYDPIAMNG